ncbi:uncharacterized protein cd34 [Acanthochromis polyacanthus]|uniref:uncharacterized protein cd34 n=1 Tax=Acanthochromis polyacanthus TaxID=80966 RepID=UPI0022341B86|nr:uncharacterized protein cd34 [Acanthochromis polyacanthus]
MAASMWRMNGLCRRMAGVLVLCTLLLSCQVMCQEDTVEVQTRAPATDASGVAGATDPGDTSGATAAATPDAPAAPTGTAGGDSGASAAPGGSSFVTVIVNTALNPDVPGGDASVVTAAPVDVKDPVAVTEKVVKAVVPDVTCVGEDHGPETKAVEAVVDTKDCEETKLIIQQNPAAWCNKETCQLEVFQDGNKVSVTSSDADERILRSALHSKNLKDKLGLQETKSSNYSVFVGILITGLLAALALTLGYFKCQRRPDTKGVKLAEEAYPVDQENQGNTLVSVAPLNPPPETPEKPSVNGESPEAAKTQPSPPTNGHSTTKTADTEL